MYHNSPSAGIIMVRTSSFHNLDKIYFYIVILTGNLQKNVRNMTK